MARLFIKWVGSTRIFMGNFFAPLEAQVVYFINNGAYGNGETATNDLVKVSEELIKLTGKVQANRERADWYRKEVLTVCFVPHRISLRIWDDTHIDTTGPA